MTTGSRRALYWAPRVLGILFALFLSLFALDVFGEGRGFWEATGALLIHLIPTYFVVAALVAAWRWEWIGAVVFTALAVLYVVWTWGRFPFVTYLTMSGPLFVIGVLFYVNWRHHAELHDGSNHRGHA